MLRPENIADILNCPIKQKTNDKHPLCVAQCLAYSRKRALYELWRNRKAPNGRRELLALLDTDRKLIAGINAAEDRCPFKRR